MNMLISTYNPTNLRAEYYLRRGWKTRMHAAGVSDLSGGGCGDTSGQGDLPGNSGQGGKEEPNINNALRTASAESSKSAG